MKKAIYSLSLVILLANLMFPLKTSAETCDCNCDCCGVGGDQQAWPYEYEISDSALYRQLRGKIILNVDGAGEAYYVLPDHPQLIYLDRGKNAFQILERLGTMTRPGDLKKIKIGIMRPFWPDSDVDGLSDNLEIAIGTNPFNFNTDSDRWSDYVEVTNGYNPKGAGKLVTNNSYAKEMGGRILLQDANLGYMWYVNPSDDHKYFLSKPEDADILIRQMGLGVSNYNFWRLLNQ